MPGKATNIKVISLGLAALYALSFVAYVRFFVVSIYPFHALSFAVIFAALFAASIGLSKMEEWARKTVVILNCVLIVYIVAQQTALKIDLIPTIFVLMCIITVLFFNQTKIKVMYVGTESYERKSILIIDDDPGLIKTIKPVLLGKGYSVLTANTGEKGLQVAKMQKPDVILLDVILPGVKGREVCVKLKEDADTRDIPVLFLTAKDSPDDVEAEKAAGAISHITKPFNRNELLSEVRKALDMIES